MQRYGLVPLPDDFELTREEQELLDKYNEKQQLERRAVRIKEEEARAKLAARDAEFQQKTAPARKRKKKKRKKDLTDLPEEADADSGGEELDDDDDDDDDDDMASEDEEDLRKRTEAKLAALREEVAEAKQSQENEEDAKRAELLETKEVDGGIALKRKNVSAAEPSATSLIANLTAGATPPHDFSKKLGLTAGRGKVLFPMSTDEVKWTPPTGVFSPNDGAFVATLSDFNVEKAQNGQGNNTLAIKFMAPDDSKRFSINIALTGHDDFDSVLFHFNPRHFENGGQLLINSKETGFWRQDLRIQLSQIPVIFGQTSCTLIIQINGEGFDVFLDGQHCARLEHRTEIPSGNNDLILQFPSTDDRGKPENWAVYKVWWGNRPIMAKEEDLSHVAGVDSKITPHPRKVFIRGLPKIYTEAEVDLRRAELERAFRKYGGDRGVQVIVPTNTYAFVEMESERQTDLALNEMAGLYNLSRAKRSRHEVLQEERAATEAGKATTGKRETNDWD